MKLFEALSPEAQQDLLKDNEIELVTVIVRAVPDPEKPDDTGAMKITAEITDDFSPGTPWINDELLKLFGISS
jgi:hypothetical protein